MACKAHVMLRSQKIASALDDGSAVIGNGRGQTAYNKIFHILKIIVRICFSIQKQPGPGLLGLKS
jgi:hypothetical protein